MDHLLSFFAVYAAIENALRDPRHRNIEAAITQAATRDHNASDGGAEYIQ